MKGVISRVPMKPMSSARKGPERFRGGPWVPVSFSSNWTNVMLPLTFGVNARSRWLPPKSLAAKIAGL
ncbi:MAG TPA: hypothetical protein VNO23_00530 [Candidatus Binatia bacterium]|nr:hypothetical protein [Candidatus Binatia bacterium]